VLLFNDSEEKNLQISLEVLTAEAAGSIILYFCISDYYSYNFYFYN